MTTAATFAVSRVQTLHPHFWTDKMSNRAVSCLRTLGKLAVLFWWVTQARVGLAETPLNALTAAEQRGGWKLLFDGKTTNGWRNYQRDATHSGWTISAGTLHRAATAAGDLVTVNQYRYFELSLEYRISKGGNSGIMFHVTEDAAAPWHTGPEIQIQDNLAGRDPQKSGWLYQLYKPVKPAWAVRLEKQTGRTTPDVVDATRPAGQWNHVYLRVAPTQSEVAINGISYYYFRLGTDDWKRRVAASKFSGHKGFGTSGRGHICLQDHGDSVSFRNIKLRPLSEKGTVSDPVDGTLAVQAVVAFPGLKWEGFNPIDAQGKVHRLRPMVITHGHDGSNRLFVATQRGAIHVFPNKPSTRRTKLFLDLSPKVSDWKAANEEGLLGMALHPKFADNGRFYVYYSARTRPRSSIVSEFRVSADDRNRADANSERIVMRIPQPYPNHNGGSIAFGPDGFLYIALGDGGGRNDPLAHGQNLSTWLGSILRIDVDRRTPGREYAIPANNPFLQRESARPEIYAYGLRNVWRMSFDRQTGQLWAADVGQDLWEEINVIRSGGNYGWSIREAVYGFGNLTSSNPDVPRDPIWEYDHQVGKSITGGLVYRGRAIPQLAGQYVYADFVTGKVWALNYDHQRGRVVSNKAIASDRMPVLAFGDDEQGEIYLTVESADGRFYRLQKLDGKSSTP